MRKTKNIRTCIFILKNVAYLKEKRPMGGFVGFCQSKILQVHTVRRVNFPRKGCARGGKE